MKAEKKQARSRDKLAALLGMEAPERPTGPSAARTKADLSREAEGVLSFVGNPKSFTTKTCRRCSESFMVNRANVSFCSDHCREKELADIGITWRWDRTPEQRWYYVYDGDKRNTEPLVIGVEGTKMLLNSSLTHPHKEEVIVQINNSDTSNDLDDSFLYGDTEQSA